MNISIRPIFQNGYINNFKKNQTSTNPQFGNKPAYRLVSHIETLVPDLAPVKLPKLEPNKASITKYIESLYNKESGFGVEKFDERVSNIAESIDNETIDFAHALTSSLKPASNNLGLNQNLSKLEAAIKYYKENPLKRQEMNAIFDNYQTKNNAGRFQPNLLDIPNA